VTGLRIGADQGHVCAAHALGLFDAADVELLAIENPAAVGLLGAGAAGDAFDVRAAACLGGRNAQELLARSHLWQQLGLQRLAGAALEHKRPACLHQVHDR